MCRLAKRLVLCLAGLVAVFLLATVAGAILPGRHPVFTGPETQRIGLLAGPIHHDLLIPLTPQVRERFAFSAGAGVAVDHPGAQWLIVGWGARDFYTTVGTYRDLSARAIWRGLTGDASVMRLDVAGPITDPTGIRFVPLGDAGFQALLDHVAAGFARDARGAPVALDHPGLSGRDAFFAGSGRFHLGRTCNVWVGEALRAAGLRFGRWTPAPWSVRLSLWRFAI